MGNIAGDTERSYTYIIHHEYIRRGNIYKEGISFIPHIGRNVESLLGISEIVITFSNIFSIKHSLRFAFALELERALILEVLDEMWCLEISKDFQTFSNLAPSHTPFPWD
jgi:hypothetical protein